MNHKLKSTKNQVKGYISDLYKILRIALRDDLVTRSMLKDFIIQEENKVSLIIKVISISITTITGIFTMRSMKDFMDEGMYIKIGIYWGLWLAAWFLIFMKRSTFRSILLIELVNTRAVIYLYDQFAN